MNGFTCIGIWNLLCSRLWSMQWPTLNQLVVTVNLNFLCSWFHSMFYRILPRVGSFHPLLELMNTCIFDTIVKVMRILVFTISWLANFSTKLISNCQVTIGHPQSTGPPSLASAVYPSHKFWLWRSHGFKLLIQVKWEIMQKHLGSRVPQK